jgi:hypothetical protein
MINKKHLQIQCPIKGEEMAMVWEFKGYGQKGHSGEDGKNI